MAFGHGPFGAMVASLPKYVNIRTLLGDGFLNDPDSFLNVAAAGSVKVAGAGSVKVAGVGLIKVASWCRLNKGSSGSSSLWGSLHFRTRGN